jgi:hypothetical protein
VKLKELTQIALHQVGVVMCLDVILQRLQAMFRMFDPHIIQSSALTEETAHLLEKARVRDCTEQEAVSRNATAGRN